MDFYSNRILLIDNPLEFLVAKVALWASFFHASVSTSESDGHHLLT